MPKGAVFHRIAIAPDQGSRHLVMAINIFIFIFINVKIEELLILK